VKKIKIEHQNFITEKEYEAFDSDSVFCPGTLIRKDRFGDLFIEEAWDILERVKRRYSGVVVKPALSKDEFYKWYGYGSTEGECSINPGKCHFVKHSFFIDPRGKIIPCQYFNKYVLGEIGKDDLYRLWRSAKYQKARREIGRGSFSVCSRCCK
jgi:MoaA/NifB/PqqE/SkfB family radical SAM enzyme